MSLDNHPASFDFTSRDAFGVGAERPPASWTFEGVEHDLVADGEGWNVFVSGLPLGRLERDLPVDAQSPLHWRVRDPQHDGFGVGASWGDWQDALIALVDYRQRHDADSGPA